MDFLYIKLFGNIFDVENQFFVLQEVYLPVL